MRRTFLIVLAGSLVVLVTACSYQRAQIDYSEFADRMPMRTASFDGKNLGTVVANDGGAFWNDCGKAARGSLWVLMDQTRALGGNAIGDIRWLPKAPERTTENPTCKKKWAWFLVWPVMLTPAFMSTRVEAQAYKIDETETAMLRDDVFLIPEDVDERETLVERLMTVTVERSKTGLGEKSDPAPDPQRR